MDAQHGLTVLDYSVLGIIVLSGLLALMRGFVREILSLAAWVAAYYLAARFYPALEPWARGYFKNDTGATALSATVIFVGALLVLTLVGYMIAKLIRGRALTAIDRSLGFVFGLARGALIVCLLYLGATYIPWLNMDKLDNRQATIDEPTPPASAPLEADKEKDKREKPPEWLVNAQTRPALSYGASLLKQFIPEKEIEETMKEFDEQKAKARHDVEEKASESLESGVSVAPRQNNTSSYDDKSRSGLNQLIEQKSQQ